MSALSWDQTGERLYETGVKKGVLYPYNTTTKQYRPGVAWNGLSSVTESPSGAEPNNIYADDMKYLSLMSAEELGATIEAYTYPKEFAVCDGTEELGGLAGINIGQQERTKFGLCYRTTVGNDVVGNKYGYKLHLLYGCKASPSEKAYQSINDSPEAIAFSWEVTTDPVAVDAIAGITTEYNSTSLLTIDVAAYIAGAVGSEITGDTEESRKAKIAALEVALYGQDADAEHSIEATDPYLPLPNEVYTILKVTA